MAKAVSPQTPEAWLLEKTGQSCLLAVGEVRERTRRTYKRKDGGEGQLVKLVIGGTSPWPLQLTMFDPVSPPSKGEFVVCPVRVQGQNVSIIPASGDSFEPF